MTIPFKNVPQGLRTPLFYAEIDASKANTAAFVQRALLIGQITSDATVTPNVPVISQSQSDSRTACGAGSILAGMVDAYRANDPYGEMWILPLSDAGGAVAATGSMAFTGTTTANGALYAYIAGRLVAMPIATGQTASQVAATVAFLVNLQSGLPVIAAGSGTSVNFTARNAGECGNDIDIRLNYKGAAGGEATVPGLSVAITPMAGGVTNPALTTALGNLLDTPFDFIVCSLTDAAAMTAMASLMSDATGRWSWLTQVYGHVFVAKRGTAGTLASFATGLNYQHTSCIGYNDSPTPSWKWASAFAGQAAVSIRIDPGVPLQTLVVNDVLAPPLASRFNLTVRNFTLLYGGVTTWTVDASGAVVIENMITTYVTNAAGAADNSYLEIETLFKIMYVLRRLNSVIVDKYSRQKLADNGTRLNPGSSTVTPNIIRADIIAAYRQLEGEGQVDDADDFAANLTVERDATNRNRVNIL